MQITVAGRSEFALPPQRGTAHVSVNAQDTDPAKATRRVQTTVARIDEEVRRLAAGPDASVTWFSVAPITTSSWQNTNQQGKPMPRQYSASARIKVKFADFTALADAVNRWGADECINVSHVEWTLTEATKAQIEAKALADAVADARGRATAIAAACGFTGVSVVEVADPGLLGDGPSLEGGPTPAAAMLRGKAQADSTELTPEDVRGSAQVHARFVSTQ